MNKKSKGYILIITILSIGALFFFALLMVRLQASERKTASKGESDIIAEQAAKAGIDDAYYQLKEDITWKTGFSSKALPHSNSTYTVSFDSTQSKIPYSTNNSKGSAAVTGYNGRKVPAGMIHLVSQGKYTVSTKVEEALVNMGGANLFEGALFGANDVKINGGVKIDSYNSANGAYNEATAGSSGNVGSNLTGGDPIELKGQVEIKGNITLPTGTTENDGIDASNKSTYISAVNETVRTLTFVDAPTNLGGNRGDVKVTKGSIVLTPGVYSKLDVSGGSTVQLLAGDYIFTDNIDISGQSNITASSGAVRIFAQGESISVTGGSTINKNGIPGNFIIYGGTKTDSVNIAGGAEINAAIFAPAAEVKITGTTDFYGGIVGKTMDIGGTAGIHFDENLKQITGGSGVLKYKARW